jgi:MFS family permease
MDQPRVGRRAVAAFFFVQGAAFAALVTRIPAIDERFDLSETELGLMLLLVPVVAGVGSVTAGHLSSRFHSAPVLRVAGPLVPLAVLAVGAAGSMPLLLAALVAVGFGLGAVDAAMNMQAVACQDAYGRPIIGSFFAVWSLAGILGAVAAGVFAGTDLSLAAFLALVAAVLVPIDLVAGSRLLPVDVPSLAVGDAVEGPPVVVVPAPEAGPSVAEGEPAGPPWRPLLLVGAAVTALFVCDSTVSNWSALYVTDTLDGSDGTGPLAYAGYALCLLLGRMVSDRLVARLGPVPVVRAAGLLAATAVAALVVAPGPVTGIVAFGVLGLALAPVLPQAFAAAGVLDVGGTGVAVARINVFNYVGFVLGAPLVGLLGDVVGLRQAMAVLVPVALAMALLAPAFDPRGRRRTALP